MNMFKKNGGFTLVELIVVIAILAILAGVAVPVYSGYIAKAQEANDLTQLDSIKTAVIFDAMDQNATVTVKTITVTPSDISITAEVKSGDAVSDVDITPYGLTNGLTFKSDNNKAEWSAETAKWVLSGEGAGADGE